MVAPPFGDPTPDPRLEPWFPTSSSGGGGTSGLVPVTQDEVQAMIDDAIGWLYVGIGSQASSSTSVQRRAFAFWTG